jgi:putative flippase GtrA
MNQANMAENNNRMLRTPVDGLIQSVAARFGDRSKEVERFLKFAIIGVIGTVIDFGTVIVLQATIFPPIDPTGEPIIFNVAVATSIAFLVAVISNYMFNRFWTYPDSRSRSFRRQLALFVFINFVGWFGRTIWITTSFHLLGSIFMPILLPIIHLFRPAYLPSYTAEGKLGTLVAQLIGVVVIMFWNFLANRYWTFNDVK